MRERPILFSGEMVRAILEGRKSMTRRVVRFPKHTYTPDTDWVKSVHQDGNGNWIAWSTDQTGLDEFTKRAYPNGEGFECPYGQSGDHLWVRETWGAVSKNEDPAPLKECKIEYRADLPADCTDYPGGWPAEEARGYDEAPKWRPSIHMPRWASRIMLEVMGVQVEHVQDISALDVIGEGFPFHPNSMVVKDCPDWARAAFKGLWDSLNAKRGYGWDINPFVWVITFRRK